MGANEIKATVGSNGEIRFDNLAHIDSLDPTDLLSIRLYLNHDAANTLWEWAFTRNGLHVYYEVPGNTQLEQQRSLRNISDIKCSNNVCSDIEILGLLAPEDKGYQPVESPKAQPEAKVRTLGGMRLRYRYIAPSLEGIVLKKVTWTIAYKGRYCPDYSLDTSECKKREAGQPYEQEASFMMPGITPTMHTYWEPLNSKDEPDWTNWAGTETNDKGISALLDAEYTVPVNSVNASGDVITVPSRRRFKQPFTINTRELKPATGTEKPMQGSDVAMLEAMLWQFGISPSNKYGYTATRISDESRQKYLSGTPSIEKMVLRLKNRLNESQTDKIKGIGSIQRGNIDNDTLKKIGPIWGDYTDAIHGHPNKPNYEVEDIKDSEWEAMENALSGTVAANGETFTIGLKYNDEIHTSAVSFYKPQSVSRRDLLKAWVNKENDRHWGLPNAPYRISEGGADDVGSIGFSQVWFSYRYGVLNACSPKKKLNLLDPKDNLLSFVVHSGASESGCDGSMYAAFQTDRYSVSPQAKTQEKLVGYLCEQGGVERVCPYSFSNYDRLVKGLVGYNAGTGADRLVRCSLPEMLAGGVEVEYEKKGKTIRLDCQSTRKRAEGLDYAMTILHNRMPTDTGGITSKFLSIPHRTFVWVGERYPTNLMLEDRVTPDPRAGTPKWCFKYGEKEWRELTSWDHAKALAFDVNEDGESQTPVGRTTCD